MGRPKIWDRRVHPRPRRRARSGRLHPFDRPRSACPRRQAISIHRRFPGVERHPQVADFSMPLELLTLDGILMANSLHFERDKVAVLRQVTRHLRPGGRFILVEKTPIAATRGSRTRPRSTRGARWRLMSGHQAHRSRTQPLPAVDLRRAQRPGTHRFPANQWGCGARVKHGMGMARNPDRDAGRRDDRSVATRLRRVAGARSGASPRGHARWMTCRAI